MFHYVDDVLRVISSVGFLSNVIPHMPFGKLLMVFFFLYIYGSTLFSFVAYLWHYTKNVQKFKSVEHAGHSTIQVIDHF